MFFVLLTFVAVLCQVFEVSVEAYETRRFPSKSFGGLFLAAGLFVCCVFVFA